MSALGEGAKFLGFVFCVAVLTTIIAAAAAVWTLREAGLVLESTRQAASKLPRVVEVEKDCPCTPLCNCCRCSRMK